MSRLLVLSEHEVQRLLDMESCVEAMADVLVSLARGQLFQPLRFVGRPQDASNLIGLMPAYRAGTSAMWALKEIVGTPDNQTRALDAHQGGELLHARET